MIRIFEPLEDGNWHNLDEITEKTNLNLEELIKLYEEASKNGLIEYNPKTARVRLSHNLTSMILQIQSEKENEAKWEKKGVGTAIIPVGKAFKVQSLWIRNQTEDDLEIKFTYNIKPREIVISKA